jgi:MFS superfamily sulfate permease-like transporter
MNLLSTLKLYLNPFDGRYEDLKKGNVWLNVTREFSAGLIVAMVAIPMAMGFAMASGLKPEQGIVGGAVAGLLGALYGGSKYQVYGPTAAFIPIIAAMMVLYDNPAQGHAFVVLCSIVAGAGLLLLGLAKAGQFIAKVPFSIVVGFTIGIAIVIAMSQIESALGLKSSGSYTSFTTKVAAIYSNLGNVNYYGVAIAAGTFIIVKYLLRVSKFIPAPLIALGIATVVGSTLWADMDLVTIRDKYGAIPVEFTFTPPMAMEFNWSLVGNVIYFSAAIIFVAGIESLLCSRMADRLANNKGLPYHPNKELWGQGMVNIVTPLFNGFPHTGALARTATNIKVGGQSPLAGIFKFVTKLIMAAYLAQYLELVPMACIGGILLYIASAMIKFSEIKLVWNEGAAAGLVMIFTAVMVVVTDFLIGVLAGLALYFILIKLFPQTRDSFKPPSDDEVEEVIEEELTEHEQAS